MLFFRYGHFRKFSITAANGSRSFTTTTSAPERAGRPIDGKSWHGSCTFRKAQLYQNHNQQYRWQGIVK